ncbi:hypothetical protein M378DRAFT_160962 [Amanita muscaria Koide BX008]|uniref:RRM domain-containing protein n=1 Tax=Amanita muscaria (strain Koide BX008) TaxID=946122 RepID=A0A0C2XAZ0_AMAMK|nr:hypothetical protein M378DRAFT_160962 [Amanita muscaria Koide BX008]
MKHFIIINVCLEAVFVNIGTRSRKQRESRGFGVVTMETAEEAEAVIMYCFERSRTRGKILTVDKARRGARILTRGQYYDPPNAQEYVSRSNQTLDPFLCFVSG